MRKFASICMLENVGRESYASFTTSSQVLRKAGLAMRSHRRPTRRPISQSVAREVWVGGPGYYNPSLGEILRPIERDPRQLHLVDVENMRYHYALTLRHGWNGQRNATGSARKGRGSLAPSGYLKAARDLRAWRRYVGISGASSHGFDNSVPLTRHTHYEASEARAPALEPE